MEDKQYYEHTINVNSEQFKNNQEEKTLEALSQGKQVVIYKGKAYDENGKEIELKFD